jgi:hypothetical protein
VTLNLLIANYREQQAIAAAMAISLNRASGAQVAGDEFWRRKQFQAAQKYALELSPVLVAQVALNQLVAKQIKGTNLDLALNPDQIELSRQDIVQNGFDATETNLLSRAGVPQDNLPLLRQILTIASSKLTAVKISDLLANQESNAAILRAAKAYALFGLRRN